MDTKIQFGVFQGCNPYLFLRGKILLSNGEFQMDALNFHNDEHQVEWEEDELRLRHAANLILQRARISRTLPNVLTINLIK